MNRKLQISNYICALCAVAALVGIFIPFWSGAGDTASLMGIAGRQYAHYPLIEELNATAGGFSYTDITGFILTLTLLCPATTILCIVFPNSQKSAIVALVCGATGIGLCLFVPAFRLGQGWFMHLIIYCILTLCSFFMLINSVIKRKDC